MYALITLYFGYLVYLTLLFFYKKKDYLSKRIAILLAFKLIVLTVLYVLFFSQKMTKEERQKNLQTIILQGK